MAYVVDVSAMIVIGMIITVVGLILGFFTLGLAWLALPVVIPGVPAILCYYTATLGWPMRATFGMNMMDIVLTPTRGRPLDGWRILIHPIILLGVDLGVVADIAGLRTVHAAAADAARFAGRHHDAAPLADGAALAHGTAGSVSRSARHCRVRVRRVD